MELRYATKDLERICTDARLMQRRLGVDVAKALQRRIAELDRVQSMEDLLVGIGKWERLKADRIGQWSARLSANWRLLVEPDGDETRVLIIEIIDYH